MSIDATNDIIIDDIPRLNRKTGELNLMFELAEFVDQCIENGEPATGPQVVYKLCQIAGGGYVYLSHRSTIERNVSLRLNPIRK